MSTTQHTPGPWQSDIEGDGPNYVLDKQGCCIAIMPQRNTGYCSHGKTSPWEEACKNARLIAAAPELLAALQAMVWLSNAQETYRKAGVASPSCWHNDDQTRRTQALTLAAQAISKAQGGAL